MTALTGRGPSPSRSAGYHRAVRLVGRWAAFYTRDLDPSVAGERRDELASDLWEQGADADSRGASGAATELSILWRAARGVPADLSWRRARGAGVRLEPGSEFRGWSGRGSAVVALVIAALVLAVGLMAIGRVAPDIWRGHSRTILTLATLLLAGATVLLARRRMRWLGAAAAALGIPAVLYLGVRVLLDVSATAQWFADGVVAFGPTWWNIPAAALLGALALFYLAFAIAWFPARATDNAR